jgi:hypothetical protein
LASCGEVEHLEDPEARPLTAEDEEVIRRWLSAIGLCADGGK